MFLFLKKAVTANLFISFFRIHNRWLHKAFNNLITEIVNLSNSLIQKESCKLFFKKILGLSQERNDETVLKIYKGFLTGLNSLEMLQNKNVIVSYKDDTVFLHAPVEFEELCVSICCRLYFHMN